MTKDSHIMAACCLVALIAPAAALVLAFPVMWLWNWLMPSIFHLPTIGYWQSVGIMVLASFLTGGVSIKRK